MPADREIVTLELAGGLAPPLYAGYANCRKTPKVSRRAGKCQ